MNQLTGRANPDRGKNWRNWARTFYDQVQMPCILTSADLDQILEQLDPAYEALGWSKHRRGACVERLRNAAVHDEMNTGHYRAYTIRWIGKDLWRVAPVEDEISEAAVLKGIDNAIKNAQQSQRYLQESLPEGRLPEWKVKLLEQSSDFTVTTLESCKIITQAAFESHRKLAGALRELQKLPALSELPCLPEGSSEE